jgi:hypothetical protein
MARIAIAGECLLVLLCVTWSLFERPAPFVNIRWREGLSVEARRTAESQLYLENGQLSEGAWRYELTSPRSSEIAAIIAHPDVVDTHRIDRGNATLTADAGRGMLRVWWAGPFKGARSGAQFRVLLGAIALVTLLCAWTALSPTARPWLFFAGVRGSRESMHHQEPASSGVSAPALPVGQGSAEVSGSKR